MLRRREGNAAGEGKRRCSRCLQSLFRSPKLVEKRLQLLRIQFLRHEDSMVADQNINPPNFLHGLLNGTSALKAATSRSVASRISLLPFSRLLVFRATMDTCLAHLLQEKNDEK
nr:hypothetical protein Iba_chr04fCG3950 [Ipomoea batatas]GMD29446.1 hypothetical protein Iba_chr08fCG3210 [Ipomoea batatas]